MTASVHFLLLSGEKVGRATARMRGLFAPDSSIKVGDAAASPLIRHAAHDTFSPEGRRIGDCA